MLFYISLLTMKSSIAFGAVYLEIFEITKCYRTAVHGLSITNDDDA
jgi:hypothetical protein